MKVLLVYPPFCTPASPPFSLTYLHGFLKNNSKAEVKVFDLNIEFHKLKFPKAQEYFKKGDYKDYEKVGFEFLKESSKIYSENNKKVVNNELPEHFDEIIQKINQEQPDIVAFSLVYSSQAFYTLALLKHIKCKTVIGGPCTNKKLSDAADYTLKNEVELLQLVNNELKTPHEKLKIKFPLDYSIYNLNNYFTKHPVIPLKTSSTCYYKQCTFCSHYAKVPYKEYNTEIILQTIKLSNQKHFFLIDDMVPKKRLLELANVFKPLNIMWACQLKPTKDLDLQALQTLFDSGLRMVIWGVESGNQRVLDKMKKGTKVQDVKQVLSDAHQAGIKNVLYIMFGFPTETKEELLETIEFLKENEHNIDLISESVFGLQEGTPVYNNPEEYNITNIQHHQRTVLDDKITYQENKGLAVDQAALIKKKHKLTFAKINKFPKAMNFFREHMLCLFYPRLFYT